MSLAYEMWVFACIGFAAIAFALAVSSSGRLR